MWKIIAVGVMLGVALLAAACGGASSHGDIARIEATEIIAQCSDQQTTATADPTVVDSQETQVNCHDRGLAHLTASLWRIKVAWTMPGSGRPSSRHFYYCQTFDAARYSPGSKAGQGIGQGCS